MLKKLSTFIALSALLFTTSACTMSLDRFGKIISPSTGDNDQTPTDTIIKGSFPLGQPAFNLQHKSFLSAAPDNKFVAASLFDHRVYVFSADGKTLKNITLPVASKWPNGEITSLGVDSTGLIYVALVERISGTVVREYIQKYDLNGTSQGVFKEFAQEGGQFPSTQKIMFNSADEVYLGLTYFNQVRKYSKANATNHLAAYGTYGTNPGEIHSLDAFTIDSGGNVFVIDSWTDRLQKYLANGSFDAAGSFNWPTQVTPSNNVNDMTILSNGNFLVSQSGTNGFLVSFNNTGALSYAINGSVGATIFTTSEVAFAEAGNEVYVMNSGSTRVYNKATGLLARKYDPTLINALGIARDTLGNTYVSDTTGVKRFDSTGFKDLGFGGGALMYDIDMDSQGIIYGADFNTGKIRKFNPDGTSAGQITLTGTAYFLDIVYDKDLQADVIYQTDSTNGLIRKLTTSGFELGTLGAGNIISPISVAVTSDGGVVVSDKASAAPNAAFQALMKINADNSIAWSIPAGGAGNLTSVFGIAIDSDGSILVADALGSKVVRFSANGAFLATYGQAGANLGDLTSPVDIVIDSGRNFYVSELGNHRVQKFNAAGVVQTE